MDIPSSPNPVGSGARALGMGGAFIAIADDATAASWNPGGLIQLEKPELSLVVGYYHRTENNIFPDHSEASGSESMDNDHLNYLSLAYPFELGQQRRNMIVSLNYQRMYDFNRDLNYAWEYTYPLISPIQYNYEQNGALYALGFAYCLQITPDFSAGITLNYWGDFIYENKWEKRYSQISNLIGQATIIQDAKEEFSFKGWNANLGFLWRISEHWTLGGVFKTPFTASIERMVIKKDTVISPTGKEYIEPLPEKFDEELNMPMSYGLGAACRFSDNFTMSGDIYRTRWNDFEFKDSEGNRISPLTRKNMDDSDIDPTTWFRLGGEYLIIGQRLVIPFRAGIFYDPAPAEGPCDDYYGFSLGTGLVYKCFVFDVAYQFRLGNNVGSYLRQDDNFYEDIREHNVYVSLIIHF
ncbi:MAG: hypothetical protein GY749_37135 [Desulfobacteraceae bacterium]|nr:hypothetical protein [Desulfobacteraceae bacterium]